MWGDAVYNDGSKLTVTPKPIASSPKPLGTWGALRPGGGMACGLWDEVTGEEDGASMQEGHIQPGSEPHAGRVLLPAPAAWVGMGERCTDGAGQAQPSPKIVIL